MVQALRRLFRRRFVRGLTLCHAVAPQRRSTASRSGAGRRSRLRRPRRPGAAHLRRNAPSGRSRPLERLPAATPCSWTSRTALTTRCRREAQTWSVVADWGKGSGLVWCRIPLPSFMHGPCRSPGHAIPAQMNARRSSESCLVCGTAAFHVRPRIAQATLCRMCVGARPVTIALVCTACTLVRRLCGVLQSLSDVEEDLSWLWDDPNLHPDLFDDPPEGSAL